MLDGLASSNLARILTIIRSDNFLDNYHSTSDNDLSEVTLQVIV